MDPVSLVGLTVAVIELLRVSRAVLEVIKTLKDGDKELAALSHDVSSFSEALVGFDRVLRGRHTIHRVSSAVIHNLVEHSALLLQDMRARLVQISTSSYSAVRRAKWAHHKSAIGKLHSQMREKNAMLHTFLSITQAETLMAITSQIPKFMLSTTYEAGSINGVKYIESVEQVVDVPTGASPLLKVPEPDKRSRRYSGDSMQTVSSMSSASSGATTYMERLSVVSSATSIESTTSWGSDAPGDEKGASEETSSVTTSSMLNQADNGLQLRRFRRVPTQDMFLPRQSCHYDCHCRCHEQMDPANTNDGTKPKRPSRFSSRKSSKAESSCNETTCRGNSQHGSSDPLFAEHSKSFRKALSQVLSAKSISIRYDLKTYRMVPEGFDAVRHVKHGNLDKLKACIESGEATIHDTAPDGWSLLHTAAYNRQLPIVKYLIELGADTDVGDVGTRTPADLAILKSICQDATDNEHNIVDVFRSRNDDVLQDFEFTPIHIAVLGLYDTRDTERPSLEELIQVVDDANNAPANTNWNKWKEKYAGRSSPLFSAIIEYFRASAYEGHPKGATGNKNKKIIHNLIDRKDSKYAWTPLHWAASAGRLDEMRTLVEHGADPLILSNLDASILHAAAESRMDRGLRGALKIWKRCSDRLDINQVNRWGETALHVAAWCSAASVKLLLDAGADPDVREENGQVPLHCAGLSEDGPDRRQIAALLCEAKTTTSTGGGDSVPGRGSSSSSNDHINAQDLDGRPPIFDFLDDPDCVELLVRHGARLDIADYTGNNVLHHACLQGENKSLEAIFDLALNKTNNNNNADDIIPLNAATITARNENGNTPLIEALSAANVDCAMVLLNCLASSPSDEKNMGKEGTMVVGKDGWAPVHYAAKIGDPGLLEAVFKHPSFEKGAKTLDLKRANVVAMEAGNWSGRVKELILRHDYMPRSMSWDEE